MLIQVFGPGCANCKRLEDTSRKAIEELNLNAELLKVQSIDAMVAAGVMRTPALGIDGKIVIQGRVPSVEEIKKLLQQN